MRRLHQRIIARTALGLTLVASITLAGNVRSAAGASQHAGAFQVAVLTPGTGDDGSWGQAVATGARIGKQYVSKIQLVDNMNTPDQYQQQGSAFAAKHYQLVILANGSDPDVTVKLAQQYPKTMFCEVAATIAHRPANACTVNLLFQNGDFLAGALAGMITRGTRVGVIGGFNFPVLNSEMEGFVLGARWVNHKITASETFINSWTDVAAARAAALAQIGAGANIIFSATDQATQGIYAAAQAHQNTYVISQYFDTHSQAPKVALTSVLFNLQGAVATTIKLAAAGKLKSDNYVYGPRQHVGDLAPFYNLQSAVPPAVQKRLDKIKAMLLKGSLSVPFLGVSGSAATYNLSKLPIPPM